VEHLIILVYFLCFSSGLGGIAAVAVVYHRIRHPLVGWYFRFLLAYTLSLAVIASYFYIREIAGYYDRDLSLLYTAAAYGIVGVAYRYAGRLLLGLSAENERGSTRLLMRVFTGANFTMSALALLVYASGDGGGALDAGRIASLALSTLSLVYFTYRSRRLSVREENPELRRIFRALFLLLGGYLLLAPVQWLLSFADVLRFKALSLDFVFYLAWNVLHVVFTVRYFSGKADDGTASYDGEVPRSFIEDRGLTAREVEMIRLIGRGLSNKEIAAEIGVSLTTVRTHIYNLYQKTGAASRVGLLNCVKAAAQCTSHTKI